MFRDDRRLIGEPTAPAPGEGQHLTRLNAWRALTWETQKTRIHENDQDFEASRPADRTKIRVGLWCPCLGLGGAEVWQLAVAKAVDLGRIEWSGAAVIEGRSTTDPAMERELSALMPVGHGLPAAKVLAADSDVILSWAVVNLSATLSGLANPPRVVMACHFPSESPWGPQTATWLEGVSQFVGVSELAIESIPASLRDRVEVIWNAVDSRRMVARRDRETMRGRWGIPPEAQVAGYLGRLAAEKDPDAMLRLATVLPESWHVVMVGEGWQRPILAEKIETLGLSRVHLVGNDPDVGDVLGAFDTLFVPSRYESFGLTMSEGFWAGVPVIATRSGLAKLVPGLVREVRVEATGQELAEALFADQADHVDRRSRVVVARVFARSCLGLDRFGAEWTDLLVRAGTNPIKRGQS